jgi:hypothetical protein
MKLSAVEVRKAVTEQLVGIVDPVLSPFGFKRSRAGRKYSRARGESIQNVEVFSNAPRHRDDPRIAHLSGDVVVVVPEVNQVAQSLAAGDRWLLPAPDITLGVPIGFTGPKHSYQEWEVASLDAIPVALASLSQFLVEYTIPFLDKYATARDIARGYDETDRRLSTGGGSVIRIAAAYICAGDTGRAIEYLKARAERDERLARKLGPPLAAIADLAKSAAPIREE